MIQNISSGNKLTGIYLGTVIQHCTHGYCKIWIPAVYPLEWKDRPDMLPAATQASSIFGGTNTGSGVFSYPNIGSIVYCFFANGDQNLPVYFAASLGGENAFGQYEYIHPIGEIESEKHKISSEKSWLQFEEHGELKLQVEDPDRRDAKIIYGAQYNDKISSDHVSARLSVDKINTDELSNLHCGLYFDNYNNKGTIHTQTYYSNPLTGQLLTTLSTQISTDTEQYTLLSNIVEKYEYKDKVNQNHIYDNALNNNYSGIKTQSTKYQKNISILKDQEIEETKSFLSDYNIEIKNTSTENANSNYDQILKHKRNITDSYSHFIKKTNTNITSSLILSDNYSNKLLLQDNQIGGFESISSINSVLTQAENNNSITIKVDGTIVDKIKYDAENGLNARFMQNITKTESKGSSTTLTDNQNHDTETRNVSNGTNSERNIKGYYCITSNGSKSALIDSNYSKKISTKENCLNEEFKNNISKKTYSSKLDTKKGVLEITIKDLLKHKSCTVILDSTGDMTLDSSTSINITSPTIKITGKDISITGTTTNILGSAGDCVIRSVSLLNHVHTEMQGGDIVYPNVTKTNTAVNSN